MTQAQENTNLSLDSSDDDGEQNGLHSAQESYRSEIEDIVKGFILEKDLMSQGHQDEMLRMKQSFDREKADLLRHLEEEREVLRHNSRMTSVTSNETGYISGSHDSDALHLNLYGAEMTGISSVKRDSSALTSARYDIDDNLVKDIAEVYLRLNNGMITSRIRPDLDIEDKFEREREIFERKFIAEKRELKRKLEEEYSYKLEQEKGRFESQIQEMKSTITDLQWQKRELESKIRNEKEKWEINFERERNEIEKRHLQMVHEMKKRIEEKHSKDIVHQKDIYEENISELQADITKLTTQLRELNENLRQEKEVIMNKFEKEIKEMEQTFSEQRNSIKLSLEAEFALKLENEISVFKTINKKLQEDLEAVERDKKEYERKQKEERRKIEERYEEEISEMERKHTEEKRSIKLKLEERYQHMIINEKTSLEVTVNELREEIVLLRQDNAQIEAAFDNRNTELRRQLELERDEYRKKFYDAENEIKIRLENEFSQKAMNESSGHLELVQQLDRDLGIMKARYGEVEGAMMALRQERDLLARERDEMQRKLMNVEFEIDRRKNTPRSYVDDTEIDKLKEALRNKDQEISNTKLQKEQIEISMSGLRREKIDLEDEVAKLKRSAPISEIAEERSSRPNMENSELVSLQQNARRKDEEMQSLKRDKFELDSRILSLQRKNDELEDELSALRRKKLEVEDEISSVKRDKADSDNQISVLRKDKMDLEENIIALKRKQTGLEDTISTLQRENMNKDHEISLMKRTVDTMTDEVNTLKQKLSESANENMHVQEQHTPKSGRTTSRQKANEDRSFKPHDNYKYKEDQITKESVQNVYGETQSGYDDLNQSLQSIEEDVEELVRQKKDLEHSVRQLTDSKAQLERNIAKLQKQHGTTSPVHRQQPQIAQREIEELEIRKQDLEAAVEKLEGKKEALERDVLSLQRPYRSSSHDGSFSQAIESNFGDRNIISLEPQQRNRREQENVVDTFYTSGSSSSPKIQVFEKDIEDLERKRFDLENAVSQLDKQRQNLNKEISDLKYQLENETATQKESLDDTLAGLKDECIDLENCISRLRREESGLEGHIKDLKVNEQDLNKRIRDLEINEQRIQKDIVRFKDEMNKLDNDRQQIHGDTGYGNHTQQGTARRFTGVSQVSIERVRKHDNKDHELAELRKERDSLKREIVILRKNMDGKNNHSYVNQRNPDQQNTSNEMVFTNDMKQIEHNEVVGLKKERLEIEKTVATLQRQKTETNAEINVILEIKKREEDDLNSLRRERIDLETTVTTLQSKKTRLEAELSVIIDEMKRDDDEVSSLRRQKHEIEKEFYDLKSKKTKIESEISVVESSWKKRDQMSKEFYTDTKDIEHNLKTMRKERTEIESDIKRLQSVRSREEHELTVLRKQLKDLENQISELKASEKITRNLTLKAERNIWDNPTATQNSKDVPRVDFPETYDKGSSPQRPLSPGQRVRTSIEIPYMAVPGADGRWRRSFDATESESVMIPECESEFLQPDRYESSESNPTYNGWFTESNDHVTTHSYHNQHPGSSYNNQSQPRNITFDLSIATNCPTCGAESKKQQVHDSMLYPESKHNRNRDGINSSASCNSPQFSISKALSTEQTSSQLDTSINGNMKEDNDVIFLRREKYELQSQISELRITLTRLQAEINELENFKMVNETLNVQSGSYKQQSDVDLQKELKTELSHVRLEVWKEFTLKHF